MIARTRKFIKTLIKYLPLPKIKGISLKAVKGIELTEIYPKELFKMPQLDDFFGNFHPHFEAYSAEIPAAFIAIIPNGKFVMGREEVFSADGHVVLEITAQKNNSYLDEQWLRNALRRVIKFNGANKSVR